MKRTLLTILAGFAVIGMPCISAAGALDGGTTWFNEDVNSFEANATEAWGYSLGAATRNGSHIDINASLDLGEVNYLPAEACRGYRVVIENTMSFSYPSGLPSGVSDDIAAISVVDNPAVPGSYQFAVMNPSDPSGDWIRTDVDAILKADYIIKIDIDYEARTVSYAFRSSVNAPYEEICKLPLPETAALPKEFAFTGVGSVATMDAEFLEEKADPYDVWKYATGVMTWNGEGTANTSVDINNAKAKFTELKKSAEGAWVDGDTYIGNTAYASFPGYSGAATKFYNAFVDGATGYAAPGMALRFVANDGDKAGKVTTSEQLALAGLLVEKGADNYILSQSSNKDISIGDPSGERRGRIEVGENFVIENKSAELKLKGFNDIVIADDRSLTVTNDGVVVDFTTPNAGLSFVGYGQLALSSTLVATGGVVLSFADYPLDRTAAYIKGKVTIDDEADIVLPAGMAENDAVRLCTGTLKTGNSNINKIVRIGDEDVFVTLKFGATAPRTIKYSRQITFTYYTYIKAGAEGTLEGSDSEAKPTKFSGQVQVEGTLYVKGFMNFSSTKGMLGSGTVMFDGSYLDGLTGDKIKIITLGKAAPDTLKFGIYNTGSWVAVVDGKTVYAVRRDYTKWSANPALFAWEEGGRFHQVNPVTGDETGLVLEKNTPSEEIPGQEGEEIAPWRIWSASEKYLAPGYALQFAMRYPWNMDLEVDDLALGGIVVESGVTGVRFDAAKEGSTTRLGDTTGLTPTCYEFNESLVFARNGEFTICGETRFEVASGKVLDLNSAYPGQPLVLAPGTVLALAGAGEITNATLVATGNVTIAYNELDKSRTKPFIRGSLKVDAGTTFRFPAGVTSYKLCDGTLTATGADGMRIITVGSESYFANVTFNASTKTASWTKAEVNHATLNGSKTYTWSASGIPWDKTYGASKPSELTLTADSRVNFSAATTIPALNIDGPYTLQLGYAKEPTIKQLTLSGGAKYEIVIPTTTSFLTATGNLTVPMGETYVIEGATSAGSPRPLRGVMTVEGTLKTTGAVKLSNPTNSTIGVGRLVVASGTAVVAGSISKAEVYGTLDFKDVDWTMGAGADLAIYEGGSVTSPNGSTNIAINITQPVTFDFRKGGNSGKEATFSAACYFRDEASSVTFNVDEGVTGVFSSTVVQDDTYADIIKVGKGTLRYNRATIEPKGLLTIAEGEFAFAKGEIELDFVNNGQVRVMKNVVLTTTADTVGKAIVDAGGTLVLKISDEDADYGYVAPGVTLAAGQNVFFMRPDGTVVEGRGNRLDGSGCFWTDSTGDHKWTTASNWSGNKVPTAADMVVFPVAATVIPASTCKALEIYIRGDVKFNCSSAVTVDAELIHCNANGSFTKDGAGELILNAPVGNLDDPFAGPITISKGTIRFARTGSYITGNVTGGGNLVISDNVMLPLLGENSYTGTTTIGNYGVLAVSSGDIGATSAIIGGANAAVQFNNLTIDKDFELSKTFAASGDQWRGYIWLRECNLVAADFSVLGVSRVKVTSTKGYFRRNSAFAGELIAEDEDGAMALDVTGGDSGRHYTFDALSGDGTIGSSGSIAGFQLAFKSAEDFTGSIEIGGDRNMFSIYFTDRADSRHQGGFYMSGQRTFKVDVGMSLHSSGKVGLDADSMVNVFGGFSGTLVGSGTLRLNSSATIDSPAETLVGDDWTGMVRLADWQHINESTGLGHFGNANSRVGFENCAGYLYDDKLPWEMVLCESDTGGDSFTANGGADGSEVSVAKVSGGGIFRASASTGGAYSPKQVWRFLDIRNVTGGFVIDDDAMMSFVFGTRDRSNLDSCFDFSEGFDVPTTGLSAAPNVTFDKYINVIGESGAVIMKVTGRITGNFDDIQVFPSEAGSRKLYGLKLDGDTRKLSIVLLSAPPTMNIDDVKFVYGTDMTNATVRINVSDYWNGVNYLGGAWALVVVRDSDGVPIGAVGGKIDGDGAFDLGPISLFGSSQDYYFDIRLEAYESDISDPVEILDTVAIDQSAHHVSSWIDENVDTFLATDPEQKTGNWLWSEYASASVTNREIRVEAGSIASEAVGFNAYTRLNNDIVEVDVKVRPDGGFDEGAVFPDENTKAAFMFFSDGKGGLDFGGFNPATGGFERLFIAGAAGRPLSREEYDGRVTFNYREGTVSYSIEGIALTNAEGTAYFPMDAASKAKGESIGTVRFIGNGNVATMKGRDRNSTLAQVGDQKYEDVDEAVEAALKKGEKVTLLWDASWRPTAADIGKRVEFDNAGYRLTVDGRAVEALERDGYRLRRNEDGTYTVDIVTFKITFTKNNDDETFDGSGDNSDYTQEFSALEPVIKLLDNRFARVHYDFDHWNPEADGSGSVNWKDGETVDMSEYGFTDVTLHAQWKVAARKIIIEPADESVYIETVTTNGVENSGITFFGVGAATGNRSATFEAEDGADLVVRFSTDIEKWLTPYNYIRRQPGESDFTIKYDDLPKVFGSVGSLTVYSELERWAFTKGITRKALADSEYAQASRMLNVDRLLDRTSKFEIADFAANGCQCTFKVTLNGVVISDKESVRNIIFVTDDLDSGWSNPAPESIAIDAATGLVTLTTANESTFIRIVIPKD